MIRRKRYSYQSVIFAAVMAATAVYAEVPGPEGNKLKVEPKVTVKAYAFNMQDVRLLDGPFKDAMDREGKYLLELELDQLLHTFRLNAGLDSQAEPLGGWEAPGCELRGHFIGHYLSACALMFASTGDERFKNRADLMIDELAKCQAALGTSGYLSAFPESFIERAETTGKVWAPYYTLHKILAGLLDVYTHCDNQKALYIAGRFGKWVKDRNDRLSDEQIEKMLDLEHGGINEAMANLYALTGNDNYLAAARRLCHKRVLDPLAAREDRLAGLHANTQFPKVIGAARLYELTGDERYRTIAEFFWDRVVNHHSYVNGGNSDHEHFGAPDKLSDRISPWTVESCNTYNMLKLTRHVFAWDALAEQAEYYERGLFNHILPTQDPLTGMMGYHIPLYGGWFMPYNTPRDSFWCCTGSGVENHAKYGDSIYWHDADSLYVNLFIASELVWKDKSVTVRQETQFPEEDTIRLTINCRKQASFTLNLRYPAWAGSFTCSVNGKTVEYAAVPGSYVNIKRKWKDGDSVEVKMPMNLRLVSMPDNPNRAAVCYGPLVLAGMLGSDGIKPPMPYAKSQSDYFHNTAVKIPVMLCSGKPVTEWVEPVAGKPLTFRTKDVGRPSDVTLVPLYATAHEHYTVYWDLLTDDEWQARQDEIVAEEERRQAFAERIVDEVCPGEQQSETDHDFKGENTNSGNFNNRKWRDGTGWFSYKVKVLPDKPMTLACTYWGSDGGQRVFDILVNDDKIATQKLARNNLDKFYDQQYQIPETLTSGKEFVTVRFQAHPEHIVGGLFGLMMLR